MTAEVRCCTLRPTAGNGRSRFVQMGQWLCCGTARRSQTWVAPRPVRSNFLPNKGFNLARAATRGARGASFVFTRSLNPMDFRFTRRSFLLTAAAVAARAQDATFSTDVKVVNVLATVRDKQGKIVPDLTKEDFDLAEDGHPRAIRYFSRETDLPLTLGLLVDTSLSQRNVLGEERTASRRFVEKVLREDRRPPVRGEHEHEP